MSRDKQQPAAEKDRQMMEGSMDAARIIGYLKGKSILITGSTGFLGKSK